MKKALLNFIKAVLEFIFGPPTRYLARKTREYERKKDSERRI